MWLFHSLMAYHFKASRRVSHALNLFLLEGLSPLKGLTYLGQAHPGVNTQAEVIVYGMDTWDGDHGMSR